MPAGFLDLDVRFRDATTGEGVAVDSIHGVVKNFTGQVVETITPDPYTDLEGVYYSKKDYDVRDATKFAGLLLTVDWVAQKLGVVLPTFSKEYGFAPVAPCPANKTVIYWSAPGVEEAESVLFYEVWRKRVLPDTTVIEELAGRSFGPSFIDKYPFENEFEARAWEYYALPAVLKETIDADGKDYEIQETPIAPEYQFRSDLGFCILEGGVVGIAGRPGYSASERYEQPICFRINWRDRGTLRLGNYHILPEEVYAEPLHTGKFEIALLQDVVVEMRVPVSNWKVRFIVPRQERVCLGDLELERLYE